MKAKKSLGQHFLRSEKALSQIIFSANISKEDTVLEVGPGTGALTLPLVSQAKKVIAIEKDSDMVSHLEELFADEIKNETVILLQEDILKYNIEHIKQYSARYKLVANIPYYITGAIIEKFLSASFQPTRAVLLIQKEVAERIVARDKKESILSIAVKVYGAPKIVDRVPRGAFTPPPSVDSAILLIENISRDFFIDCDETLFFTILKTVFGKKRKQIAGSLSELFGKEKTIAALQKCHIDPKARPEDLTKEAWKKLTIACAEKENSVQ